MSGAHEHLLRGMVRAAGAVAPPHRPVIATDADGTLWEGDIGDDLFVEALSHHPVGALALSGLRDGAREVFGDRSPSDLRELALALIAAYRAGEVSIERICQIQSEVLGDRTRAELDALLDLVAARVAARIRPAVRVIVEEAASAGVAVHVVTGSLGAAVANTLRRAGLAHATVSGATLRVEGDRVLPSLAHPIPLHGGKVDALRAVGAWPPALGLGDGGWDATFLGGCAVPLLVHPSDALLHAMVPVGGVMILRDGLVSPRRTGPQ
ncbi:MAG: HAD family hydrolase [Deltaproteobacteria bacterium]|nr:HAD family hydrolase [Myxococcales bacterium]MDP3216624.1 HAD family hydrolase [Deltaproteobacteria bacterium]